MLPKDAKSVPVSGIRGLLTNVDSAQINENFAERTRGFRYHRQGTLGDRDKGTKHEYPNYPTTDVAGFPEIEILDYYPLYDPETGQEHDVVVGLDSNGNTRVYVNLGTGHDDVSTSAVTVASGTKTFTVTAGKSFKVGERILVARTSAPTTTLMEGRVASYSGTTLVVFITRALGAVGPFADWTIYGGWMELTRRITAKVNDAAIGATDTAVNIDTIVEDTATLVPALSEFVGYLAVNKGQVAGVEIPISAVQDAGSGGFGGTAGLIGIETSVNHGFSSNQSVFIKDILGAEKAEGYGRIDLISLTRFQIQGSSSTFLGTYVSGGTAQRYPSVAVPSIARITDNTTTALSTSHEQLGSAGLNWADNDDLELYPSPGVWNGYAYVNGVTPHVEWNPIEAQRKVNLYYGNSDAIPIMRDPVRIQKVAATPYFYATASGQAFTEVERFTIERGGGDLNPTFKQWGTPQTPLLSTSGQKRHFVYQDNSTDPWLEFLFSVNNADVQADIYMAYVYMVLIYDGYQVSEPVFAAALQGLTKGSHTPTLIGEIYVSPSKMPKNITGIEFYIAPITQEEFEAGQHVNILSRSYLYRGHIPINNPWDPTTDFAVEWAAIPEHRGGFSRAVLGLNITPYDILFTRRNVVGIWMDGIYPRGGEITFEAVSAKAVGTDIVSALGHAPRTVGRTWLRPRYATRSGRDQGVINVVDQDDAILRLSAYGGDGAHMDDSFPDVTVDAKGMKQKIFLSSRGELLGLSFIPKHGGFYLGHAGPVVAFKHSEAEIYDIDRNGQAIVPTSCVSKRSILSTPIGLMWAGKWGINMIPASGGNAEVINLDWRNMYDGSLLTEDEATPFMTDAYRSAIITGWDPTYGEILIHTQISAEDGLTSEYLVFRLGKKDDKAWSWNVRKFALGGEPVKFFATKKDGTLSVGFANGILKYPNMEGAYQYNDNVPFLETSSGAGFETSQTVHFGSIYTIAHRFTAYGIDLDYVGESVDGEGKFELKPYANDETDPFQDTLNVPIDERAGMQRFERRGPIEQFRIEMGLPTGSLTNFKRWELSTANLWAVPKKREGNR